MSKAAHAQLLDSLSMAYVEPQGTRRLTVVNLVSGEGWEEISGTGAFRDFRPMGLWNEVFVDRGVIRVLTSAGRVVAFDRSGRVLDTDVVDSPMDSDSLGGQFISGFTREGLAAYHFYELPIDLGAGSHQVRQGIRIGDESHDIADLSIEVWGDQYGRRVQSSPPTHSTRGDLVAYAITGSSEVHIRTATGLKSIDVGWPVEAVSVDASQRIWVRLHRVPTEGDGYGWLVLDRTGQVTMKVVPPRHFVDAFEDWMLVREYSEPDTLEWALYRMIPR